MANIKNIIDKYKDQENSLLDIIRDVQAEDGLVSADSCAQIAEQIGTSASDIQGVVSFYHFFTTDQAGQHTVYLNNNPVAYMNGRDGIAKAFEAECGVKFGEVSADGIGLHDTSCIGMNDQEPSAIIDGVVFTSLTAARVKDIVAGLKGGKTAADLAGDAGDGKNQDELVKAAVNNNIHQRGDVILADYEAGSALKKAAEKSSADVIAEIKQSNLRGRGGAGFPTGMKWDFCSQSAGDKKYVICNADEGEPGTFKDRVILTELPQTVFEGMALGGYAIGADEGIIYLRAEYMYLKSYLDKVIADMKSANLLGDNIAGKSGFNFNITVKLGAGAYICGEESALIESAEGKRGVPRNRPPFPVQDGYNHKPTIVNNVETYVAAAQIMSRGASWFTGIGGKQSSGTKVLSISGDCAKPGIYEIPFETTLGAVLEMCGAKDTMAVQVGGPSGQCVPASDSDRKICYDDLATGGSMIVIGKDRDLLSIVQNFMEFFVEESCGWCVPCRAGNVILLSKLDKIIRGAGVKKDLEDLKEWSDYTKSMSRCGLGQTSPNPIATTLTNFPEVYEAKVSNEDFISEFDHEKACRASCEAAGRKVLAEEN